MSKESFIAVVGSANVDLTTFNDAFPRPGETIFGKKFDLGFGGKGANQAVGASLRSERGHGGKSRERSFRPSHD